MDGEVVGDLDGRAWRVGPPVGEVPHGEDDDLGDLVEELRRECSRRPDGDAGVRQRAAPKCPLIGVRQWRLHTNRTQPEEAVNGRLSRVKVPDTGQSRV